MKYFNVQTQIHDKIPKLMDWQGYIQS